MMSKKIKSTLSGLIGVPAAFVGFCEVEDLRYWWIPFIAWAIVFALLAWNGLFTSEEGGQW